MLFPRGVIRLWPCTLSYLLCPVRQWSYWLAGRHICSLRILIPGRKAVNGASVGGLVLLCTLHSECTFLGMTLCEWNGASTCFWSHINLWITSLCKYFACSKLHPQTLDYHCCCVTLAASFLCFCLPFSAPVFSLLLHLSRLQFNVSISLISLPPYRSSSVSCYTIVLSVRLSLPFLFSSYSFLMLSLAFEAGGFVPDSHSSDWDILGFKVTQTDLLS